jgi:hypothetical protein
MIAGGTLLLLAAIKVLVSQRRIVEVVPYSKSNTTIELPSKWDDNEVTRLLQRYQDQPAVLSHAIASIKSRMVMNQDLKTAQKRLKLIASVIELFKLNQALQGILYDIHLAEKDFEIRQVETQIRLEDAHDRLKSEGRLRQLRTQRDEMQLQKEITQLRNDTDALERPARPEREMSPEQKRAREKQACEDRIANLKEEKQKALKAEDQDERVLKVNAIDDAIQRETERWAKLL